MSLPLFATDVQEAADRLVGVIRQTPLETSERLSAEIGVEVFLKREDLQVCRSFKARGAYNIIAALSMQEQAKGVVAASAGNHAQGVAYACSRLGISGTIYLPSNTPRQKRARIAAIGGELVEQVIVDGPFDLANNLAQECARKQGKTYVHPYDDPITMAGQGTVAVEICQQLPRDIDTVLVPLGGGGLIGGIATWMAEHRPETKIIGVEPEGAASMRAALSAGKPVNLERVDTFVDGTAVALAGAKTFAVVQQLCHAVITVPEGAVCTEMLDLYHTEGVIAEPAGALASAAARRYLPHVPRGPVVAIVSGGNNDLSRYAEVLERSARHEGFRHYFLVTFRQEPGALRTFLNDILTGGEDIVHFEYTKKNNRDTGPALVGIELQDPTDIGALRQRMAASPLTVQELEPDSEIFRILV